MSFKTRVRSTIRKRIVSWGLPDSVFVEVMLRLEQLGNAPTQKLVRVSQPFDGMVYGFDMVDPANRFRQFTFLFHVLYGQDEATLAVVNCRYHAEGL